MLGGYFVSSYANCMQIENQLNTCTDYEKRMFYLDLP